jgi:L,D-transpeptidase ErfK/SrfK
MMLLCAFPAFASQEFTPGNSEVIGTLNHYLVKKGDSLIELARAYGLGFNEITEANPGTDPFIPRPAATIRLPMSWVLPNVPRNNGIVINLSEMRLYCFPARNPKSVITFPIGIGDEGSETPVGSFIVTEKKTDPAWRVPASIRRLQPHLPRIVPPGPDNPLGSHALRLSAGSVLIHGTNKPWGVGRKASHGCIRLYPEDIPKLYGLTPKGARVVIVRQPVKIGGKNGRVFLEVHRGEIVDYQKEAIRLIKTRRDLNRVDMSKVLRALREMSGMPVDISL